MAERQAILLLQRLDIRQKIEEVCKANERTLRYSIISCLKKIAFNDNCQSILRNDDDGPYISNLSQCSELKIPKPGTLEIKFIDRLRALDMLVQLMNQQEYQNNPNDFYNALSSSVDESCKGGDPNEV